MIFSWSFSVVDDMRTRPSGWNPFSSASPHSYPSEPEASVAVSPGNNSATRVLRQNRRPDMDDGTVIAEPQQLTVQIDPISAFSGRPPSDVPRGGLKRGSRQVPVHSVDGSIFAPASVSL
jgi:hypothetical protein